MLKRIILLEELLSSEGPRLTITENTLVWPFPNDMWGGQGTLETYSRLHTVVKLFENFGPFKILCAGGLDNKKGVSTGQFMKMYLRRPNYQMTDHLISGEKDSSHTAQIIRFSRDKVMEIMPDKIIAVSNYFNLWGVTKLIENQRFGVPVWGVASSKWGEVANPHTRAIQEIARWLLASIIDPQGRLLDLTSKKRKANALKHGEMD